MTDPYIGINTTKIDFFDNELGAVRTLKQLCETGGTATFIIAASNSLTLSKNRADYVCDGTDDQVEIQAAIDALSVSGGEIVLMEGNYSISATINLVSNLVITGGGRAATIGAIAANFDLLYATAKNSIKINNINLVGYNSGTNSCIHLYNCLFNWIEGCVISASGSDGGIFLEGPVGGASGNNWISSNLIQSCTGYGIQAERQHDTFFSKNIIEGSGLSGFGFFICYSCVISDNESSASVAGHGMEFASVSALGTFEVMGNYMDGNKLDGINLSHVSDMLITGNSINTNGNNGIYCDYVRNSVISNNQIFGNSTTAANTKDGISLSHEVNKCIITNNMCCNYNSGAAETNQRYGIYQYQFGATWTHNCIIKDNFLMPNATGGFLSANVEGDNQETNLFYNRYVDHFQDCLAASATAVHAAIVGSGGTKNVTTAITNPDVPRNLSITTTNVAAPSGNVTINGVDARGNNIQELIAIVAGGIAYGVKAFSTVALIGLAAGVTAADTVNVGISDTLGLSNMIYLAGDVYKKKKNNANVAIGTVDYTNCTVNCSAITATDDFTIWFKSNLNMLS